MEICNFNHEEIVHEGYECPLCEYVGKLKEKEDEIIDWEEQYEKLIEELEKYKREYIKLKEEKTKQIQVEQKKEKKKCLYLKKLHYRR